MNLQLIPLESTAVHIILLFAVIAIILTIVIKGEFLCRNLFRAYVCFILAEFWSKRNIDRLAILK